MSSTEQIVSSWIEGAPPGELTHVVKDIKALTSDDNPTLISKVKPAFEKYNEEQLATVKLPGGSQYVIISSHNRLSPSQYFDVESSTSFTIDHTTLTASSPQSYTHDSTHSSLVTSLLRSLSTHFSEHFPPTNPPSSAYTVCPSTTQEDSIAILTSTTRFSPSNYISGRWRSSFLYSPTSTHLTGTIRIHVHYYEDGNVALTTSKSFNVSDIEADGSTIIKRIAQLEKQYQEEVNRTLASMNEQSFRALRRQLPVTRQKVEWEKIRGYSLGENLRGEGKR